MQIAKESSTAYGKVSSQEAMDVTDRDENIGANVRSPYLEIAVAYSNRNAL